MKSISAKFRSENEVVSVTQGKVLRIKHGMKTCKVIPGMARLKALGCHPDHEPQLRDK